MELGEPAVQPEAFLRQLPPDSGPDPEPGPRVPDPDAEPGACQPVSGLGQPRHEPAAGGAGSGVAEPLGFQLRAIPLRHQLPESPRLGQRDRGG